MRAGRSFATCSLVRRRTKGRTRPASRRRASGSSFWSYVRPKREREAEHAGHREIHDAPEIEQAVLDRRAGERQPLPALERARGFRGLRVGVLDRLGLVENDGVPLHVRERFRERAELRVVEHEQVALFDRLQDVAAIAAAPEPHAEVAGDEALRLARPVVHDRLRADDEALLAGVIRQRAQPAEPRQRLDRLAEAHVVGEQAAEVVRREVGEKMKALELIRAQLGGDRRRLVRHDARLQFRDAQLQLARALLRQQARRALVRRAAARATAAAPARRDRRRKGRGPRALRPPPR